jgi:hypothetical protein
MSHDSDMNQVIRNAKEQGWRVEATEKGHWQFFSPDKETIVVAAGTPGDRNGWHNFLAGMRRAGYTETSVKQEKQQQKVSVSAIIVETLSRHESLSVQDLQMIVRSKRPDVDRTATSSALYHLHKKGEVVNMGGRYRLATPEVKAEQTLLPAQEVAEVVDAGGSAEGDELKEIDEALDAAMNALAQLERVMKRNRARLIQFSKMKAMFKAIE